MNDNNRDKKHLNFDLDFLESVKTKAPGHVSGKQTGESVSIDTTSNKSENQKSKPKNNKLLITAIIIGVIIFYIWAFSTSDESSNSSTTTPASSCDTSKLEGLKPSDGEKSKLDSLESTINSTHVNQYSQISVDQYNAKVNEYNSLRDSYNAKIDAYNNYSNTNCK